MILIKDKKHFFVLFFVFFCFSIFPQSFTQALSFEDLINKIDAEFLVDPLSKSVSIIKNGNIVSFKLGEPIVFFNYKKAVIVEEPIFYNETYFFPNSFYLLLEDFFESQPDPIEYRVGAILIDPGHGGKDPGASGTAIVDGKSVTIREKDIVLDVSLDLYKRLQERWPSKQIILTRDKDVYPSLEERVDMANSVKLKEHEAILYVSIHANSAFNKNSSGFEVWYLSPDYRRTVIEKTDGAAEEILPILNSMMEEEFTTESILIAKSILDGLEEQIGKDSINRGLKEEAWFVVRNARMPSVLIELGFVSNEKEASLLANPNYLKRCSIGIYNGINNFINYFEKSKGFTQ